MAVELPQPWICKKPDRRWLIETASAAAHLSRVDAYTFAAYIYIAGEIGPIQKRTFQADQLAEVSAWAIREVLKANV